MNRFAWLIALLFSSAVFAQDIESVQNLIFTQQYEQADQLLNQLIEKDCDNLQLRMMQGQVAIRLYDYQKAQQQFKKILDLEPENVKALENMALCAKKLGDKKNAVYHLNRAYKLEPQSRLIAGEYAETLISVGQFKAASKVYWAILPPDSLIKADKDYHLIEWPENGKEYLHFYKQLAYCEYKTDFYGSSIVHLKMVQKFNPKDLEALYMQASVLQKLKKYDLAVMACNTILAYDQEHKKALAKKAFILFNQKMYQKAMGSYSVLLHIEGEDPDPTHLKNFGICLYHVGLHENAIEMLDSVKPMDQLDPFIPFYLGLAYEKVAKHEKALENLEEAAFLSVPVYTADVYHHLGIQYKQMRKFKEALDAFAMVMKLDPSNYNVLFDIAITHEEYNRNQTIALNYYNEFVKQCTNSKSANLKYALKRIERIKEDQFFEQ